MKNMKKLIVAIPAYNEAVSLEDKMIQLHTFFKKNIKNYEWKIIISNNASQDKTLEIAKKLAKKYPRIEFIDRSEKSKSAAIKAIWLSNNADIYMYMDADLSTDISYIPELIKGIEEGNDFAIGSRFSEQSQVKRSLFRSFISNSYKLIMNLLFSLKVKDLQCGFKAVNNHARNEIIAKTKYLEQGFMDTEALIIASSKGYKIKEIPVKWKDERASHFNIASTIKHFFKNMAKTKLSLWRGDYN